MYRYLLVFCLFLSLVAFGCDSKSETVTGKPDGYTVRREGNQQDVSMVKANNEKMNAAMEEARRTVPQFITALQKPKPGQVFIVKIPVSGDGHTEYMWLDYVTYDDKKFTGRLMDDPFEVKGYKMGQEITVPEDGISDWMIMHGDDREGGFTEKVIEEMQKAK